MDRPVAYPGQLPTDSLFLSGWKDALYGVGHHAQATLGTSTSIAGLALSATSPASLIVNVGPGSIYTYGAVDTTTYGSLGTDASNVVKQGILAGPVSLILTPPATTGYSQTYLVQVSYTDTDGGATVLPYYNSANPSVPFSGPNNSGSAQYTNRAAVLNVALKAGIAASTGSQSAPSPDAGFIGLYTITVANGATAITSANWATVQGAPFIPLTLPQVPAAIQAQVGNYAVDSGSANAMAIALPYGTALTAGMPIRVKKGASGNTGAVTLAVNGGSAFAVTWEDTTALASGDWPAGAIAEGTYDGTTLRIHGPISPALFAKSTQNDLFYGADSGTADNLQVNTTRPAFLGYRAGNLYAVNVAHNNATTTPTIQFGSSGTKTIVRADGTPCAANDLQAGSVMLLSDIGGSNLQLTGIYTNFLPSENAFAFQSSTTFTVPNGIYNIKEVECWGGGGGGGGASGTAVAGYGGGAGGYTKAFNVDVTPGQVITVTVGAAGTGGTATGAGATGGTTTFGSTAPVSATGGTGGDPSSGSSQGTGGSGSGGQITGTGGFGSFPGSIAGQAIAGAGGEALFGSGGFQVQSPPSTGSLNGLNGHFPGGGGNSGVTGSSSGTATGGAGAHGLIVIQF